MTGRIGLPEDGSHGQASPAQRRVQAPGCAGVLAGDSLTELANRHGLSRHLIRIWVAKLEAGALPGRDFTSLLKAPE